MVSALLKKLMKVSGLKQQQLAEIMGVDLSRVKNLTAGRLQKLTREEGEALIRKLHVRAHWLATGEEPMFQTEAERRLESKLDQVRQVTRKASGRGLSTLDHGMLQEILYYVETGDNAALQEFFKRLTRLSPKEAALLDNFRHSPVEAQSALIQTSDALAKPAVSQPRTKKGG
jgi:transcriptional regulator with XRE-family HTH domain